ncbi:MAG: hypothetical protein ACHQVK_03270, partial [Candidatus Paceibacterales bacterium]
MDRLNVSIAGFNIRLIFKPIPKSRSSYEFVRQKFVTEVLYYLTPFVAVGNPKKIDAAIFVVDLPTLERVKRKSDGTAFITHYTQKNASQYSICYQTSLIYFNLLVEDVVQGLLLKNSGIGLHASSVLINKKAYIFLGDSGAGKSTLSAALAQRGFALLSDDWTYLSFRQSVLSAHGLAAPIKLLPNT